MSHPEDREFEALDRLVRAYLDRVTERTDASKLRARIAEGLQPRMRVEGASTPAPVGLDEARSDRLRARSVVWLLVAATLLIGAFLSGRYLHPSSVIAATILREAQVAHAQEVDRCYLVQYAPDPRSWDGSNVLEGPSESVLWTRGDARFWAACSIGDLRLTIGREQDGTLWVSPSPRKGIRFEGEQSQWPENVSVLCDINALTVPALLEDVLVDFDLRADRSHSREDELTSLVWARLKPGRSHPMLSSALLEIDAQNKILRRLVLWTVRDGRPNGTVTYTLLDRSLHEENQYRLESHLDPDAEIEVHRFPDEHDNSAEAGEADKATSKVSIDQPIRKRV